MDGYSKMAEESSRVKVHYESSISQFNPNLGGLSKGFFCGC